MAWPACILAFGTSSRQDRIQAWIGGCSNDSLPTPALCWQTLHGWWALASGGVSGSGLGNSKAKWSWLPEADNDFIFAIIGEELGLLGAPRGARPVHRLAIALRADHPQQPPTLRPDRGEHRHGLDDRAGIRQHRRRARRPPGPRRSPPADLGRWLRTDHDPVRHRHRALLRPPPDYRREAMPSGAERSAGDHDLLAGGGTAGHVNPLLAVADRIREREPDAVVLVLGTARGSSPGSSPPGATSCSSSTGCRSRAGRMRPHSPSRGRFRALVGTRRRADRRARTIDIVVGFGGYVSAPAYLAARRHGVPIVVHEANARPGIANRLGSATDEVRRRRLPRDAAPRRPVRRTCRSAARSSDSTVTPCVPRHRPSSGSSRRKLTLLVTGGSHGARR